MSCILVDADSDAAAVDADGMFFLTYTSASHHDSWINTPRPQYKLL